MRLVESIPRNWGIVGRIARDLGVGYDTVAKMLDEDDELAALAKQAKATSVDAVVGRLYETALQPGLVTKADVAPVLFFLKAVGGYSETQRVEHSGRVDWSGAPKGAADDADATEGAQAPLSIFRPPKASGGESA